MKLFKEYFADKETKKEEGSKKKSCVNVGKGVVTITFGDSGENHVGNQMIGQKVDVGQGFTHADFLAASSRATKMGFDAEIIDLQTLRPLDTETILNSVKKTNRLITVEESWPFGSVGSEIANIVQRDAFDYLDSPVIKVNSADVPMPYSRVLEKKYLPQVDDIILAIKEVCYI